MLSWNNSYYQFLFKPVLPILKQHYYMNVKEKGLIPNNWSSQIKTGFYNFHDDCILLGWLKDSTHINQKAKKKKNWFYQIRYYKKQRRWGNEVTFSLNCSMWSFCRTLVFLYSTNANTIYWRLVVKSTTINDMLET